MTEVALAREVLARVAAYPKQPTRKEELEHARFMSEAAVKLAKYIVEMEKR